MATLLQLGTGEARRWPLGERAVVGRESGCEVCLDDPMVSRRHAELSRTADGRWELRDLGSKRGTFRGGQRLYESAVLRAGDEILIGPVLMRFEDGEPANDASGIQLRLPVLEPSFAPAGEILSVHDLRRDYEKLRAAMELVRAIGVGHDLPELLSRVLTALFTLLEADRGAIALFDEKGEPSLRIARNREGRAIELAMPTTLVREAVRARSGVVSLDAPLDERFSRSQSISLQGIRSAMCVPMLYRDELLGIMHVDSLSTTGAFTAKDLELFSVITAQAAAAVKNATLAQRMQAVVAEDRKRLEGLIRDLPVGVLVLDSARKVTLANPLAQNLLPLLGSAQTGDELEGAAAIALQAALQQASRRAVDVTVPGGGRRTLSVSASATQAGGETVVVLRDVTEEREAEAKGAQQDRLALIGQLAGGVAHDFNNLLAVVSNYAGFIESETGEEAVRNDAREIVAAATRAAGLTKQLLAFGRREMVRPRVLELDRVVGGLTQLLRRTLGEQIRLETKVFGAGLLRVRADPAKIEQILMNLAVNARDAMPSGGTLTIETGFCTLDAVAARRERVPAGEYVSLRVSDTGVGMPPEVAAHVFEPFFTTKEKGKGTGLGLSTVYGIVQQAQGTVSLDSRVGRGTTFQVLLPLTEEPAENTDPGVRVAPRGDETVLVVEDEPAVRELTRRVLAQAGYRVLAAGSGDEALQLARQNPSSVHLLLTDVVMPGMSGQALSQTLASERPGLRVLFMSGYFDDGLALGARVPFLPKPFTREELLSRVRSVLSL